MRSSEENLQRDWRPPLSIFGFYVLSWVIYQAYDQFVSGATKVLFHLIFLVIVSSPYLGYFTDFKKQREKISKREFLIAAIAIIAVFANLLLISFDTIDFVNDIIRFGLFSTLFTLPGLKTILGAVIAIGIASLAYFAHEPILKQSGGELEE